MRLNEAEKVFYNDIKERKKQLQGYTIRQAKRVMLGVMRFPSDIMSRKDKMKYRRNGKVMTTNLYDEILTIDEFEKLDTQEQYNRLKHWRKNTVIKI